MSVQLQDGPSPRPYRYHYQEFLTRRLYYYRCLVDHKIDIVDLDVVTLNCINDDQQLTKLMVTLATKITDDDDNGKKTTTTAATVNSQICP